MIGWPSALKIGISTPYRRSGLLFAKWRRLRKDDPEVLVVHGASTAVQSAAGSHGDRSCACSRPRGGRR